MVGQATSTPAVPPGYQGPPPTPGSATPPTFNQICTLVRWHYQWLVLRDFLPRIVGQATMDLVLPQPKNGKLRPHLDLYSVRKNAWMPVEFSAAAYRFGHSLVRDSYQLNTASGPIPVFAASPTPGPMEDLRGFRHLPAGLVVEWHRFFDGLPGSGPDTQRARLFDSHLSASLSVLPPDH